MNPVDFHAGCAHEFDARARLLRNEHLTRPTPCTDWDVRALTNHVVYEVKWSPPLLRGEKYSAANDRFAGDVLGEDPVAAWTQALTDDLSAVKEPGALDRQVHTSSGPTPAVRYLMELSSDLLIHAWDLARGLGVDDALDPPLVDFCYEMAKPYEDAMKSTGLYGDVVVPADDADRQTRLLAVFGRTP